ncbi:WD repeat-containing protein tag-125 [Diplonema papillatum]|nr:WD repeat-containing protein tag-125 [Diplonema papillatum]
MALDDSRDEASRGSSRSKRKKKERTTRKKSEKKPKDVDGKKKKDAGNKKKGNRREKTAASEPARRDEDRAPQTEAPPEPGQLGGVTIHEDTAGSAVRFEDDDILEYGPKEGDGDEQADSQDHELTPQHIKRQVELACEVPPTPGVDSAPSTITIEGMDQLVPDPHVVLPLVRFWVIDGETGSDLTVVMQNHLPTRPRNPSASPSIAPAAAQLSPALTVPQSAAQDPTLAGGGQAETRPPASLAGFFVAPCDLRRTKDLAPKWNETVSIGLNLRAVVAERPEAVVLFEVIDCSPQNVQRKAFLKRNTGPSYGRVFSQVCWGFLKLQGLDGRAGNCKGRHRVQLYRSPFKRSILRSALLHLLPSSVYPNAALALGAPVPAGDATVPPLFHQYLHTVNRLDKYPSTLHVHLATEDDAPFPYPSTLSPTREHTLQAHLKDCRSLLNPVPPSQAAVHPADDFTMPDAEVLDVDDPIDLPDCSRLKPEKCLLPAFLQASLRGGSRGCLALAFSPCGKFLAVAACDDGVVEVRVHDALYGPNPGEEGDPAARLACPQLAAFAGHSDTVYTLAWSADSAKIVTCSADCSAKLWDFSAAPAHSWDRYPTVQALSDAVRRKTIPYESGAEFTFTHPCYVYTVAFHPHSPAVFTGGFDDSLRVWSTITGGLLLTVSVSSKSWVSHLALTTEGSTLFTADGNGELKLWTVSGLAKAGKAPKVDLWASVSDFKGRGICHVQVHTAAKLLYVWTRVDSCVTSISTSTYSRFAKVREFRGPRSEACAIKGCLSPCGTVLCSGSSAGPVFFWDTLTGEFISHDHAGLDFQHSGPVYAAAWSPVDHRIALASYSARLNLVTMWYRPRQEEDIQLLQPQEAALQWTYRTHASSAAGVNPHMHPERSPPRYPAEPRVRDSEDSTVLPAGDDYLDHVIAQWTDRVAKRSQRLIAEGTAVEVRDRAAWVPANVTGWTSTGQCKAELANGETITVSPVRVRRMKMQAGAPNFSDSFDTMRRSSAAAVTFGRTATELLRRADMLLIPDGSPEAGGQQGDRRRSRGAGTEEPSTPVYVAGDAAKKPESAWSEADSGKRKHKSSRRGSSSSKQKPKEKKRTKSKKVAPG